MSNIVLPTEKTPATRKNPKFLVIYGAPKVGKTGALAQLEGCLTIDIEDGSDTFNMLKVKASTVMEFREILAAIKSTTPRPYKYVAIDTIDKVEEWAERLATATYRASNMGKTFEGKSVLDLPNGYGYRWLWNEMHKWMADFEGLAEHVILVGHVRDKMLEVNSSEVVSKDLDLTGKVRSIVCSAADIGHVYRSKEGELRISFKTSQSVMCGSRSEHLKGRDMAFNWKEIFI